MKGIGKKKKKGLEHKCYVLMGNINTYLIFILNNNMIH